MKNTSYKTIIINRSYRFGLAVIRIIDGLNKSNMSSQVMAKQLLRSATSIGANVVEAQAASSKRDFINFLNHSLKSANESTYWIGLLKDSKKVSPEIITPIAQEARELSKILGSSIAKLKGKK